MAKEHRWPEDIINPVRTRSGGNYAKLLTPQPQPRKLGFHVVRFVEDPSWFEPIREVGTTLVGDAITFKKPDELYIAILGLSEMTRVRRHSQRFKQFETETLVEKVQENLPTALLGNVDVHTRGLKRSDLNESKSGAGADVRLSFTPSNFLGPDRRKVLWVIDEVVGVRLAWQSREGFTMSIGVQQRPVDIDLNARLRPLFPEVVTYGATRVVQEEPQTEVAA